MAVNNKVRAMLNIAEKKPSDLDNCLGISVQAVRNKFSRDSFSVSDLIKISDSLGWEMLFKSPTGQTVVLSLDDLKNPAAEAAGEPINGYIKKTIDDRMERETISAAGHPTPSNREHEAMATGSPEPPPKKLEKHYKSFTEADARRIDLPELLKNVKYQIDIADTFGMDALTALMEKARRQTAEAEDQQGGDAIG